MVSSTAAKKPKTFKFPKSMGLCADKLFNLRTKRLAAQKVAEAIEEEEKALKEYIINNLSARDTGAAGKHHRVQVVPKAIPQVENWPKFYAHVKRTGDFDLLQRRVSDTAVKARWDNGKKVPGVVSFNTKTVSLTKI